MENFKEYVVGQELNEAAFTMEVQCTSYASALLRQTRGIGSIKPIALFFGGWHEYGEYDGDEDTPAIHIIMAPGTNNVEYFIVKTINEDEDCIYVDTKQTLKEALKLAGGKLDSTGKKKLNKILFEGYND